MWTLFDFANTSFSIVVVTFLFAVYFKKTIAAGQPIGDFYWSIGTSVSMVITALMVPVLGAIADYGAGKKRFLLFFTLLCISATSALYFLGPGDVLPAILIFVLGNIGFEAGLVFYDSFLPEITVPKNYGRVSGYGFAMGYLGALASLGFAYPLIQAGRIKECFPLAALFFLVFSVPLFLFIGDTRRAVSKDRSFALIGFSRVLSTIKHLRNYKNLARFLGSYFCYIEGVNTVIFFSGNYAMTTLHFTYQETIVLFLVFQTTAILGSILFGVLADSIGQKKSIVISLYVWLFTMLFAYLSSEPGSSLYRAFNAVIPSGQDSFMRGSFYLVGLLSGSVMGATQSVSRSLMTKLTPMDRKTEFFGFYSFFGKSSAVVGPLVFGLVSYFSGSQRLAIVSICIFFVAGLFCLHFVEEERSLPG